MESYNKEVEYVNENISSKEYINKLDSLESDLNNSYNNLKEKRLDLLENKGYNRFNIENKQILLPQNANFQQVLQFLKQIPPRLPDEHQTTYFVKNKHIKEIENNKEYKDIINYRENLIQEINTVYTEFYNKEIVMRANNRTEEIVYLLAGLKRNIDFNIISEIINEPIDFCSSFKYEDSMVFKR